MADIDREEKGTCAIRVRHYDAAGALQGQTVIELPEATLIPLMMSFAAVWKGKDFYTEGKLTEILQILEKKVEAARPGEGLRRR